MNIFCDLHHSGLYASLHYLLENRLGHKLYRPIGTDWFNRGYWKIAEPYNNNPATVEQYLGIGSIPADSSQPLNQVTEEGKNHYSVWDGAHGYYQKAITFEQFVCMDIDIIIASIPSHIMAYRKLITDTGIQAKLIYQMGNIGWEKEIPWQLIDNVMASVKPFDVPSKKNVVFYRQEFDTNIFNPSETASEKQIISMVNCMPVPLKFYDIANQLPEYKFKSYGIACNNGICQSVQEIASTMKRASYGYHYKPHGDGFGHVIHNWAAVGKPLLVGMDDYRDKLAGELLEDMVTCVDISHRLPTEVAKAVRELGTYGYEDMAHSMKERFSTVVDFSRDAARVEEFINVLV